MGSKNEEDIKILKEKLQSITLHCENLVIGISKLKKQSEICVEEFWKLRNPSLRKVELYNTSDKLDDVCNFIIKLQNELEARPDVSKLGNKINLNIHHISINTSTNTLRYLTGDSPWNFWLEDTSPEFKVLNKLLVEKLENGHLENFQTLPDVGDSVCYVERRKVCRGLVLQHLGNDRLKITNLDTSGIAFTSLDKTYKVDTDVCELNARVIKCCLSEDFDNFFMWSSDLGRMFTNVLHDGNLFVKICKELPGQVPHFVVELIVEKEDEERVNVNEWIVNRVLPELKQVYVEGVDTLCDFLSVKALDPYFQGSYDSQNITNNTNNDDVPKLNSEVSNEFQQTFTSNDITKQRGTPTLKRKSPCVADLLQKSISITSGYEIKVPVEVSTSCVTENNLEMTKNINEILESQTKIEMGNDKCNKEEEEDKIKNNSVEENVCSFDLPAESSTSIQCEQKMLNNLTEQKCHKIVKCSTTLTNESDNKIVTQKLNKLSSNTFKLINQELEKDLNNHQGLEFIIRNNSCDYNLDDLAKKLTSNEIAELDREILKKKASDRFINDRQVSSDDYLNHEREVKANISITEVQCEAENAQNVDEISSESSNSPANSSTGSSGNDGYSEQSETKPIDTEKSEEHDNDLINECLQSESPVLVADPVSFACPVSVADPVSVPESVSVADPVSVPQSVSVAINKQPFTVSSENFHSPSSTPNATVPWCNNMQQAMRPPIVYPYGTQFMPYQHQNFVPEQSQHFTQRPPPMFGLSQPPTFNPHSKPFVPYQPQPYFSPNQWPMQPLPYPQFHSQMTNQFGNLNAIQGQPLYPQWSNGVNTRATLNSTGKDNISLQPPTQPMKCKDSVDIGEIKAEPPVPVLSEDIGNDYVTVAEKFHVTLKKPTTLLKPGENIFVMMAYCDSPSEFYVHVVNKENLFIEKIREDLIRYYCKSELHVSESWEDAQRQYGTYCACKWPVDNIWYRVEVKDWNRNGNVWVHFVDYGNHDEVPLLSIQPLAKQFTKLAMMAQPCHLANVYPNGSTWSDEAKDVFQSMFSDEYESYRAVVIPNTSKTSSLSLGIELYLTDNDSNEETSVNKIMLQKGYATTKRTKSKSGSTDRSDVDNVSIEAWNDFQPLQEDFYKSSNCYNVDNENAHFALTGYKGKDTSNVCRFFAKEGKCWKNICRQEHVIPEAVNFPTAGESGSFQELSLPEPGLTVLLKITHIVSVDRLYGQLINSCPGSNDEEETLESLSSVLNKRNTIRQLKLLDEPPVVGQLVVAKSPNGFWFRARVISTLDDDEVEVMYVDYGTEEKVFASDLRQIEPKYLHLPFQAVECIIANISESNDKAKRDKGIKYMNDHLAGEVAHARIVSSMPSVCRMEIYLLDLQNEDIGKWLIDKGYCGPRTLPKNTNPYVGI